MTLEKILLGFSPEEKNILPALQEINSFFGFISHEHAKKTAEYFSVPLGLIFSTASFYDFLRVREEKSLVIRICSSSNCSVNSSFEIIRELENILGVVAGSGFDSKIKLETMSCVGRCAEGPVVVIGGRIYEKVKKEDLRKILRENI